MLSSNGIQSNNHAPTQTLPHSRHHCHDGFNWIYFLILQFFILTFFLFLSPLYLLLRFPLQLLELGARQYRCSRDMSDRLYLLPSRFTVQYEFIKSCGYVKVAVVSAKKLARSWNEWLTGSVWELVTVLKILHSISHLLWKGDRAHIYFYFCVRTTLCLNLCTGLLCRKFYTVYDILDINDVSVVLSFRRQVILRQSDILYWNMRLSQREC
jgi:hypothetical protein